MRDTSRALMRTHGGGLRLPNAYHLNNVLHSGRFAPMIAITAHEVTPAVAALFDLTQPTMPRAFNVLQGTVRGQILVNDLSQPTWAVVRDTIYGTLYFGGQSNAPLLAMVVEHFRQLGDIGIGCWRDDTLNDLLPPYPDYDGLTLYFTNRLPMLRFNH